MTVLIPIIKKRRLSSIYIKELKGIFDCSIDIDAPLVAIMGVNGIGKSTIIHALACSFKPQTPNLLRRRFYEFFPPTTNKTWKNSCFTLSIEEQISPDVVNRNDVIYMKAFDRWTPRYDRQPEMDVYYIGIDSCCPDIEKFKEERAHFRVSEREDKISKKVSQQASYVLGKEYECILDNSYKNKNYIGVRIKNSNIVYSSLSMGAGEQRVIRILNALYTAAPYSLVLIDEIDLLLHSDALRKMIKKMHEIAISRKLQIIFTTHSLIMEELKNIVSIKYLDRTSERTVVYDGISSLSWSKLDGNKKRPMTIYVEDQFSKAIVYSIAKDLNVASKLDVRIYGAIENAFTLAAAMVIESKDEMNTLIVQDGDRYVEQNEKIRMINNRLSGTESDSEEKRNRAVNLITQFSAPQRQSPEVFIHGLLKLHDGDNEIISCAKEIGVVEDTHELIEIIKRDSNCEYSEIINLCKEADSEQWEQYIANVKNWIIDRIDL